MPACCGVRGSHREPWVNKAFCICTLLFVLKTVGSKDKHSSEKLKLCASSSRGRFNSRDFKCAPGYLGGQSWAARLAVLSLKAGMDRTRMDRAGMDRTSLQGRGAGAGCDSPCSAPADSPLPAQSTHAPHSHSTWREANQATPCLVLPANICPEYLRGALSLLQTLNTIPWLCFVGSRNPGEVLEVNNPHYGRQSAGNL